MKSTTPDTLAAMHQVSLSSLLAGLDASNIRMRGDPIVKGLTYDSRDVKKGSVFFAIEGLHTDGHLFVADAIKRGAAGIVHSQDLRSYSERISYVQVENTRESLARMASAFFGHPAKDLRVIGVTGTDGKSTTVWLIHQLLEMLGRTSGFISTVNLKTGKRVVKNPLRQSTPEAVEIQGILREMLDGGNEFAVVEATSHGLSHNTHRLTNVSFDVGVLTNVSHEHLEFHGSLEQYRDDKANLFRALGSGGAPGGVRKGFPCFGVINHDDPNCNLFAEAASTPVFTFSLKDPKADLYSKILSTDERGTDFVFALGGQEIVGRLNLPGTFHVEDLMAAALTVNKLLATPLSELAPLFPKLRGVLGRMEYLELGQPYRVIVDFAHTPEAFRKLFATVRTITAGRIIAVFGSAGERDREKRSLQGKIACQNAEIVVLTDEDPRAEDRIRILEDIAEGCKGKSRGKELFLEPDRKRAIRMALEMARDNDTVLCLGKGHEESIIYEDGPIPWNEIEITREILKDVIVPTSDRTTRFS